MSDTDNKWHLRKDVTVGNILVTIGLIITAVTSIVTFDRRITAVEVRQDYIEQIVKLQNANLQDKLDEINSRLARIEEHLRK